MSYYVKQTEQGYNIIEKDTDLMVTNKPTEKDANIMCRSLNLGSGFNGFTPSFFCYDYNIPPN